jgi:hypothetical protein
MRNAKTKTLWMGCFRLLAEAIFWMVSLNNGLVYLPPIIARQLTLKDNFSAKWPPHTYAKGDHVEPVLGAFRGKTDISLSD